MEIFQAIRKLSDHPENIKTIRNSSWLTGNFPDHPETFLENIQTTQKVSSYPKKLLAIWKISRLSGFFPGFLETFWTIRIISGLSENFPVYRENFPDHSETILTIWKLSRPFGKYQDYSETFQAIRKFSRLSGNFPVQFQGLCAETFWMAMPPCHQSFWASG